MREIKFRAWDTVREEMWNNPHFAITQMLNCLTDYKLRKSGRYIFLQYTGLKDKDGKEIYEGDIVIFMLPDCTWSNPQIVQYCHSSFVTKSGNLWGLGYFEDIVHSDNLELIEVIGNIYENKELLK